MSDAPVVVIGGGPAGLSAALALARLDSAVTLCEAGTYPRDRVCGEFLSPEVASDLEALGCDDFREALAPVPLRTILLTSMRGRRLSLRIEGPPAYALTRRALENYLATRARAHGVNLLERASVRALDPARAGFRFRTDATEGEASAVVCAFGKRSSLDAALALPRSHRPGAYAAVKTYFEARPEALEADVELHLVPGGYVGLNPVEGGRIGLCALLDGEPTLAALSLRFARNPTLADRLSRLRTPSTPIRGLARFGFQAQRLLHVDAKRVALFCGDAARLVPSFTGDGNAIAIRSGRLAAANLAAGTPHEYARAFETHFAWRFRAAAALHRAFLHPALFDLAAPLLSAQPALLDRLYAWTRGQ